MRITFIIDTLRSGGKERRLVELLKGLTRRTEFQIQLIILSNIMHYREVEDFNLQVKFIIRRWDKDPTVFFKLFKTLKSFGPNIVHSWDSMSSVYVLPSVKLLNITFVNGMIYDAPNPLKKWSKKWVRSRLTFPFSEVIVSNSKAGLEAYQAPVHKSKLIYNGYDIERLKRSDGHIDFDLPTQNFLVGMVATFSHHKDYTTYIEAAQIVLKDCLDTIFLCIGGSKDNYLESFKRLVADEFKDRILFIGPINPIEPVVEKLSIGVLSTFTEGISNAIIEYMAHGKPVIATDGGGTKELVVNEETGFLVPQKSPKELAEKINFLIQNPQEARLMGSNGKKRIVQNFNIDLMVQKFIQLYQSL